MTPTTRNVTLGAGGLVVAILIYAFGSVSAANYNSPFLLHLVDVIQGSTTNTVLAPNAPAWGFGIPMSSPALVSIATSSHGSASSGLASSTTYYFKVTALDGTGTTTLAQTGLSIKTDASNTQAYPEDILLTWQNVHGPTTYAIYFSTTTEKYDQYFIATSTSATTSQFDFSTSTGSISDTKTASLTVSTAFRDFINPFGPSWINAGNGVAATTTAVASTSAFRVNGSAGFVAAATTTNCQTSLNGDVFYNTANSHLWLCTGAGPTWTLIK